MTSNGNQKGKAVVQGEQAEPFIAKPDMSQFVAIKGWWFHDPAAASKPTPAAPGTHLSRRKRRKRSKEHFEKKIAEEDRHLEALSKLTPEEVRKLPWKDFIKCYGSPDDGEDPRSKPLKELQVPKKLRESKSE